MPANLDAPGQRLLALWRRLSPLPGGGRVFSAILGYLVPYSGSIRPRVRILEPGHALVELRDRRAVRNHLRSVHAIALANLGELTSGLAMLAGLPPTVRGIVTAISIEFRKKARGTLIAESQVTIPEVTGPCEHQVRATIRDEQNDVIAEITVRWRLASA